MFTFPVNPFWLKEFWLKEFLVPEGNVLVPEGNVLEPSHKKSTHKSRHNTPVYDTCDYLRCYLNPRKAKERYKMARLVLKKYEKDFDSVAFSGVSGALIAAPISHSMNKPLILVRKRGETCHSSLVVEGNIRCQNYIIIDDLVSSGDTAKRIQKEIFEWAPLAHCVGLLQVNYVPCDKEEAVKYRLTTDFNLDLDKTATKEMIKD